MTSTTDKPRSSRFKRREVLLNGVAKLSGCLALIVTVAGVFYNTLTTWLHSHPRVAPAYTEAPAAAGGISRLEEKRPRIEDLVRRFFTAGGLSEKLACSRDTMRVAPLMEAYYKRHPIKPSAVTKLDWIKPVSEPEHRLASVRVLLQTGGASTIVIEEADDGDLRVDWETSVLYSDLDWKDFLSQRPKQPALFRVLASRPANAAQTKAKGKDSDQEVVELNHPAEPGSIRAYFKRDDPQLSPLVEQLRLGHWENVPLTLRLSCPGPPADASAVRIAGVEGRGWLILHNTRS